jgi:hypothetical protein
MQARWLSDFTAQRLQILAQGFRLASGLGQAANELPGKGGRIKVGYGPAT